MLDQGKRKNKPLEIMSFFVKENSLNGDGTESAPYSDVQQLFEANGLVEQSKIFIYNGDKFEPISQSFYKKSTKYFEKQQKKKSAPKVVAKSQTEALSLDDLNSELEAIKILDLKIKPIEIGKLTPGPEIRRIQGWVHRIRKQKSISFIVLRDGSGFVQIVVGKELSAFVDQISVESTISVSGIVSATESTSQGFELQVHAITVIGKAPLGDETFTNKVNEESNPEVKYDQRHLVIRGDTASAVLKMRSIASYAFRQFYRENGYHEIQPPLMVQNQCEGGSTLFGFNYYDESAYLTQSSQLYLETILPVFGKAFCMTESFRAEKSSTRRHLSEYTHIEAEISFIEFEDLLNHLEKLLSFVVEFLQKDDEAKILLKQLNPQFSGLKLPIKRMTYKEAIKWLRENNIEKSEEDGGGPYEFGDDIPEAAERKMVDTLKVPVMMTHFPAEMKAFYMKKVDTDETLTESVDILLPNVGECVGGSMRESDYDRLMSKYKEEGLDPSLYYWYTDQRKYGTTEHGGYGLGLERFLCWILNQYTVKDVCLYPRFVGRCKP
eukprot:NODE_316_length_9983_cov_1.089741.p1 type:complete len:551 gc:universal NODE_316_length_9983_cov_1.089741:4391-6043(+)